MPFQEQKATEAAAFLLRRRGAPMSYLKLIKLLYLADREALIRWGTTLTGDRHVSMPHGPVVSNTYNLMIEECGGYWSRFISAPMGRYELQLTAETCGTDQLSRAEEGLLSEIFERFGHLTRWQLVEYTHTLPEWHDPKGSSIPISVSDILRAQNVPEEEIEEIVADLVSAERAERVLSAAA
ncbi:MAG: Panacea domain-containing protein [Janthinobacterium lividum]